jgi:WD40 repeat protein
MYHKEVVEKYPLQVYASALLFSPADSLIRRLFQHEEPRSVAIKPYISKGWSACLQTLEGHSSGVNSVAFSLDSARLASASASCDSTVKIWDAVSGACLQTLERQCGSDLQSILATPPCNEDVDESQQSLHHDSTISVIRYYLDFCRLSKHAVAAIRVPTKLFDCVRQIYRCRYWAWRSLDRLRSVT